MSIEINSELDFLSKKIETNTAVLADYQRYELLLKEGGLPQEQIYSYLQKAGLKSWQELITVRKNKEMPSSAEALLIGSLLGLALGLILSELLGQKK